MSNVPNDEGPAETVDELLPEYHFDYSKARPNRFARPGPAPGRSLGVEPGSIASKEEAIPDALADSFQSVIENGTASERFQYMQKTFVMLLHKVGELEKENRWAHRRIEELGERLAKAEKAANA